MMFPGLKPGSLYTGSLGRPFGLTVNVRSEAKLARMQRVSDRVNKKIDNAYLYIAGAIRRNARKSMKTGTKTKPHSKPGSAANSPKPMTILKNTIHRDYNPSTKKLIVGPTYRGFYPPRDGAKPAAGKTIPQLLEYGGYIHSPKATVINRFRRRVPPAIVTEQWRHAKARKKFYKRGKLLKKDFKWVVIPSGTRKVDPRPTMRLAFNKTVTAPNLKKSFDRTGVVEPASLTRVINTSIKIGP